MYKNWAFTKKVNALQKLSRTVGTNFFKSCDLMDVFFGWRLEHNAFKTLINLRYITSRSE